MHHEIFNIYDKNEALAAAIATKTAVEEARRKAVTELLEAHRYRRKYGLFGPKVRRTDEQTKMQCDRIDLFWAATKHFDQYETAKYVIEAARRITTDMIALTCPQFLHLSPFWPDWKA